MRETPSIVLGEQRAEVGGSSAIQPIDDPSGATTQNRINHESRRCR